MPRLQENLSLSLAQAGSLSGILQAASLLNPIIGYLGDRTSLHFFVIAAPAVSATLMCAVGWMPGYWALVALLLLCGLSVAAFHVPAPAMIAQIAGRRVGLGMSLFMAAGEGARTVGPLLVVWAVGMWGLAGIWRTLFIGYLATAFLYWRFRNIPAYSHSRRPNWRAAGRPIWRIFRRLIPVMILRSWLNVGLSVYLPTLLVLRGYSFEEGGIGIALWSGAGVLGALLGGTLSDRFGRSRMLLLSLSSAATMCFVLLYALEQEVAGWLLVCIILASGFFTLSATPVMQAVVLENSREWRATANGLFMQIAFGFRLILSIAVGALGDAFSARLFTDPRYESLSEYYGLALALGLAAVLTYLSLPFVWRLRHLATAQ
ncbi:MAG: MFS transporter [Chloroflexi bacterium]|nr:MFS transporter [Chloroflexota bacterium]